MIIEDYTEEQFSNGDMLSEDFDPIKKGSITQSDINTSEFQRTEYFTDSFVNRREALITQITKSKSDAPDDQISISKSKSFKIPRRRAAAAISRIIELEVMEGEH